jgi:surface protein
MILTLNGNILKKVGKILISPEDHSIVLPEKTIRFEFSNSEFDPRTPNGRTWLNYTYYSSKADNATWTKVEDAQTNQWDCTYNNVNWSEMFEYISSSINTTMEIIASNLTGVTNINKLFYENSVLIGRAELNHLDDITSTDLIYSSNRNITSVVFDDMPSLASTSAYIVYSCINVTSVKFGDLNALTSYSAPLVYTSSYSTPAALDTVEIGDMQSLTGIRYNLLVESSKVKHLKLGNIPKVTNITCLTNYNGSCKLNSLESFEVGDTSKVINATGAFKSCSKLTSVSTLNMPVLDNTTEMFRGCTSLITAPTMTTTNNLRTTTRMFLDCTNLTTVSVFNTSYVTNMEQMFAGCSSIISIPAFNTQYVSTLKAFVEGCTALTSFPVINTSSCIIAEYLCKNCTSLTSLPNIDYSSIQDISCGFQNCTGLTSLASINLPAVKDVGQMFDGCVNVKTGILDMYNMLAALGSQETTHGGTFRNCGTNTTEGTAELEQVPSSWK